jgi:hypothetical protein
MLPHRRSCRPGIYLPGAVAANMPHCTELYGSKKERHFLEFWMTLREEIERRKS